MMDILTATVVSNADGKMVVRVARPRDDCDSCGSCPLGSLCRGDKDRSVEVTLEAHGRTEQPGATVQVEWHGANQAHSALLLFVPALLGLCFGGSAAACVWGEGDGVFLAGTGAGLVLGVGLTWVFGRLRVLRGPVVRLV